MKNLNNKEVLLITVIVWIISIIGGISGASRLDSAAMLGYFFGRLIISFFIAVIIDLILVSSRKK